VTVKIDRTNLVPEDIKMPEVSREKGAAGHELL
jgi:hypothetical protein